MPSFTITSGLSDCPLNSTIASIDLDNIAAESDLTNHAVATIPAAAAPFDGAAAGDVAAVTAVAEGGVNEDPTGFGNVFGNVVPQNGDGDVSSKAGERIEMVLQGVVLALSTYNVTLEGDSLQRVTDLAAELMRLLDERSEEEHSSAFEDPLSSSAEENTEAGALSQFGDDVYSQTHEESDSI